MASAAGPIADLSYRNYDGPLEDVGKRWWTIAKMTMRMALKKKWFWALAVFSTYGYGILSIIFYFLDTFADSGAMGRQAMNPMTNVIWKDQVLTGFSLGQLWIFCFTLLIGAGVIAADTRANALLVYLSKPVTKADYLLGKWLGMFLLIVAVTGVPMLLFTAFNWMSYRQYGHWDTWLLFKLIPLMIVPAFLHSSIMLGVSAMFNQGRVAGAVYAGIYFLSGLVAGIATGIRMSSMEQGTPSSSILDQAMYFSVPGMIEGLGKVILGTPGSAGNPFDMRRQSFDPGMSIPEPNGLLFTFLFLVTCMVFVLFAWKKVRAVEVVGS